MANGDLNANRGLVSLEQTKDLGQVLAASKLFTDAKEAAQAVVKVLAGRELGFGPIASMMGVYFVKNRVSFSANMMAAAIQASGKYRYRVRKHTKTECVIDFQEKDEKTGEWDTVGPSSFDMDDAKLAGLASGSIKTIMTAFSIRASVG